MTTPLPKQSIFFKTATTENDLLGINGKIWRHTIGRAASAISIPIYLVGAVFQGLKTLAKALYLPDSYLDHLRAKGEKTEFNGSWSHLGVANEAIMTASLLERTFRSFCKVIVAPSFNDSSFVDKMEELGRTLNSNTGYQQEWVDGVMPPSVVLKRVVVEMAAAYNPFFAGSSIEPIVFDIDETSDN